MINVISRYGILFVIPVILLIIIVVMFTFKVVIRTEITVIQVAHDEIIVYMPVAELIPDTIKLDSPETGFLELPIDSIVPEVAYNKIYCQGNMQSRNSLIRVTIETRRQPIYETLIRCKN